MGRFDACLEGLTDEEDRPNPPYPRIVIDYPESLEVAVRRALELDDNARNENYSDNIDEDEKSRNRCAAYASSHHNEAGVVNGSLPRQSFKELMHASTVTGSATK